MNLRQLRYFVVLAEELRFRHAAERLSITQAPPSVAIQMLKREVGAQLFHPTQRRVELTELKDPYSHLAVHDEDPIGQAAGQPSTSAATWREIRDGDGQCPSIFDSM